VCAGGPSARTSDTAGRFVPPSRLTPSWFSTHPHRRSVRRDSDVAATSDGYSIVHPARVGTRLDDHHRARVAREQAVERARGGVEFAERVRPGTAVGNARHALVPTQINGDNRVTHRKPPTGAGD